MSINAVSFVLSALLIARYASRRFVATQTTSRSAGQVATYFPWCRPMTTVYVMVLCMNRRVGRVRLGG